MQGLWNVPFHPDESTQIYMSSDVQALLQDPSSLAWMPEKEGDLKQHYHELDAPLTRTMIGIVRLAAGIQPLPVDWDWSASWEENRANGAVPDPLALLLARAAVACLFPFSLVLSFLAARRVKGTFAGIFTALLFTIHPLILLHTRRAMAESALVFGICLSIWGLLESEEKPWLAAIGMALAFNAKHSAIALLPVGLLAAAWLPAGIPYRFRKMTSRLVVFITIFAIITFALNPFLWRNPVQAALAALRARQEFVAGQVATLQQLAPGQVLNSPVERLAAMLLQLFILPPAVEDAGNYIQALEPGRSIYLASAGNTLMRGLGWGGLWLALSIFGFVLALLHAWRTEGRTRRDLILLISATVIQALTLLVSVPIPWQRYWMPLLPFVILWTIFGLWQLVGTGKELLSRRSIRNSAG